MIDFIKFIFLGKRALDTWALNMATTIATEVAFEKLIRENPEVFKKLHFEIMGKKTNDHEMGLAEAQRDWELGKVKIIDNYIGPKKMDELREKLAETITKFFNK